MARDEGEPQAMTAERLAEIESRVIEASYPRYDYPYSTDAKRDMSDLLAEVERQRTELEALAEKLDAEADYGAGRVESLAKRCAGQRHRAHVAEAEVERLRAREARLLAVVEDVARAFNLRSVIVVGREEPHVVATLSRNAIEQARALLASTAGESERSGGDGA